MFLYTAGANIGYLVPLHLKCTIRWHAVHWPVFKLHVNL